MSVFAPEPVFQDTPFAEPLRGSDAVKSYWADVPLYQAEISFTAGEIFTVGPWFATEFKCTFRRRRTGEWVDARGAIFCETNGEKITEMRMYWERR
jgi:ketosteroid isomerase-like protein